MNKLKNHWFLTIIALLVICATLYLCFKKGGLQEQKRIQQEIEILTRKNDSLQQILNQQEEIIQKLSSDSFYMEFIARTKFGMAKKGEIGYQFIQLKSEK